MWLLLLAGAHAEVPLPDYDRAVAAAQWHQMNLRIESVCEFNDIAGGIMCHNPDVLDAVIADGMEWTATVQPDPGITYLVGLAWRYKGNNTKAQGLWEQATREDPEYLSPWYDLGELHLSAGNWSEAERAFEEVRRLTPEGIDSWLADWRLAEVAAFRQEPDAFEKHMREALRKGFTFDRVAGLPNWQGFVADPVMRPSVEKLISVYGTRDVLESLRTPQAPQ